MAAEEQENTLKEDASEASADQASVPENAHEDGLEADATGLEVQEELSEREVFAGDEDFFEHLAKSEGPKRSVSAGAGNVQATVQPPEPIRLPTIRLPTSGTGQVTAGGARFSTLEKVLVAGIFAVASILLYALLKYGPWSAAANAGAKSERGTFASEGRVENPVQLVPQKDKSTSQQQEAVLSSAQPLSLKVAEDFYLEKDYDMASAAYAQLHQNLSAGEENELLRDFLQLRMALCAKEAADFDQASRLFGIVSESRSPVVRVVASYHLGLLEMLKGHYLRARTRAYEAVTLIGAVEFNPDWALSLEHDCRFLIAEAMSRSVLLLCDADKDLPEELWMKPWAGGRADKADPFTGLNEEQLRTCLNSGSGRLRKAVLGPRIEKIENQGGPARWSVVCHMASIEELLARFAAKAGLDIRWPVREGQTADGGEDAFRKRPVCLCVPAGTVQQILTAAAGCVGLVAFLNDNGTVDIYNPAAYTSLSDHVALLGKEAVSICHRFLLAFHDEERVPNIHFALGLLYAQRDQVIDAIAEYRLVSNRFSQTPLAPFALLYSSRLKTDLHDYAGAQEDLRQLVEQYPDAEFFGQACLYLADATMKAGRYDEGGRLYRKVYSFGFSAESRAAAALGAGRCFYETKDYEDVVKWLTRYIAIARDRASRESYLACFLLGKTYLALGKPEQAGNAFRNALVGQLTEQERMEAVSGLVDACLRQEDFVEALDVLESARSRQYSEEEFAKMLLLKVHVLRNMGLVDKAIATLSDRAQYWPEPQLKARLSFELAQCYVAKGNLDLARKKLTEILTLAEPGALANEIALELAEVCLKLGEDSRTIRVCSQLLGCEPSAPIEQRALVLLAKAYGRQRDYDKAARALSGRRDKAGDRAGATNKKVTLDSQPTSG